MAVLAKIERTLSEFIDVDSERVFQASVYAHNVQAKV